MSSSPRALGRTVLLLAAASCSETSLPPPRDGAPPGDADGGPPATGGPSVLEHHGGPSRAGVYVAPTLTRAAARTLHRDAGFHAALDGPTYAQPLYFADAGPGGLIFVATERNQVSAFHAATGAIAWRRSLGAPVARDALPCGNVNPLGVTGTPVINPASRSLLLDAMTAPATAGAPPRHLLHALSVDDGSARPGWPVDVAAALGQGFPPFDAAHQNQRGALTVLARTLYVPFGGHYGDCAPYRGWVLGVPLAAPASLAAFSTRGAGGGVWAPGGVASDGSSLFVATGNTSAAAEWGEGEAILRLGPGPTFSRAPGDYFSPVDWRTLDDADLDIGGTGVVLFDLPGATPDRLAVAIGKSGTAYLVDRTNLGGISAGLASAKVATNTVTGAPAVYATATATYVVFPGHGAGCPPDRDLVALRVAPGAPPVLSVAWCATLGGAGGPIVSTTDGHAEAIVWAVGAEATGHLRGFDGDTGALLFDSGAVELGPARRFLPPLVAAHRLFVASDTQLSSFTWEPAP